MFGARAKASAEARPPLWRPWGPLGDSPEIIVTETMFDVLQYVTPEECQSIREKCSGYDRVIIQNGNTLVHLKPLDRPPLQRPAAPLDDPPEVIVASTMDEVLQYVTPEDIEAMRRQVTNYDPVMWHNGSTLVHLKPLDRPMPIDAEVYRWYIHQMIYDGTDAPPPVFTGKGKGKGKNDGKGKGNNDGKGKK